VRTNIVFFSFFYCLSVRAEIRGGGSSGLRPSFIPHTSLFLKPGYILHLAPFGAVASVLNSIFLLRLKGCDPQFDV